jgi:hypothetical protein
MILLISVYGIWIVGFLVLLLLGFLVYDKRYKSRGPHDANIPPHGYLSTQEVFIDPKDGHKYRVFYNPRTGEREYIREA